MATVLATAELDRLDPKDALTAIAQTITSRARDPEAAALFRIVATEAVRFPDLAEKCARAASCAGKRVIANYLRGQVERGTLRLPTLTEPPRCSCR